MYHSITIGDKNTWDDWHLIPSSRPVFVLPEPNIKLIEIPGGVSIDMTETHDKTVTYKNRIGSFSFYVDNDYWDDWTEAYSNIKAYLNNEKRYAVLEDDPNYAYYGSFYLKEWKTGKDYSTITVDYSVRPYKIPRFDQNSKWLWDNFDFSDGIVTDYKNLYVNGALQVSLSSLYSNISPTFYVTQPMTVTYKGVTHNLAIGFNYIPSLVLGNSQNTLLFSGNGYLTIMTEGGVL